MNEPTKTTAIQEMWNSLYLLEETERTKAQAWLERNMPIPKGPEQYSQ